MSEILLEQLRLGIKDILLTCKYYHTYWEEFSLIFIWVKKKKKISPLFSSQQLMVKLWVIWHYNNSGTLVIKVYFYLNFQHDVSLEIAWEHI